MKKFIIALTCIVMGCSYSFAQQRNTPPQKGYYSIGNNAQKLETAQPVVTSEARTTKGYYVTTEKAKPGFAPIITIGTTTAPAKGYYSIGDNHKKLGAAMVIANAEYGSNSFAIY